MGEINVYDPRFSALKRMQRSGKNASTILQDNRNLVMQLIYENGSISRKQLADITGSLVACGNKTAEEPSGDGDPLRSSSRSC